VGIEENNYCKWKGQLCISEAEILAMHIHMNMYTLCFAYVGNIYFTGLGRCTIFQAGWEMSEGLKKHNKMLPGGGGQSWEIIVIYPMLPCWE